MNIAEKLKELREDKRITQQELIKEIEKTQNISIAISSIKNYENVNNPRIPQGDILLALARYYDVSIESLLDDKLDVHKNENLNIGKELFLNDRTIKRIKDINKVELSNAFNEFCTNGIFIDLFCYLNSYSILKLFEYYLYLINTIALDISSYDYISDLAIIYEYDIPSLGFGSNITHYLSDDKEAEFINKYKYDIKNIVKDKKQREIVFSQYLNIFEKIEEQEYLVSPDIHLLDLHEHYKYKRLLDDLINNKGSSQKETEKNIIDLIVFLNKLYYSIRNDKDVTELKINKLISQYLKEL